ncbi:hypothetical protein HNR52_000826 [Thermoanaerobacterium thermosulfurigenes]
MKKKIKNHIEDILILSGLTLIVIATFLLNIIIGIYVLGLILLALGIYFTRR